MGALSTQTQGLKASSTAIFNQKSSSSEKTSASFRLSLFRVPFNSVGEFFTLAPLTVYIT